MKCDFEESRAFFYTFLKLCSIRRLHRQRKMRVAETTAIEVLHMVNSLIKSPPLSEYGAFLTVSDMAELLRLP